MKTILSQKLKKTSWISNSLMARDEEGFSTIGMALSLLITISLIFSAAQIYQINEASSKIQSIADASALAAENAVAEFYIVARVCDAVVLSLSLTSLAAYGIGIAALCTPATAAISEAFLKAGNELIKARNSFAEKAAKGLNTYQKLLPFISMAKASAVVLTNSGGSFDANYIGIAVLLPFEGEEISVGISQRTGDLANKIEGQEDEIREAAEEAEKAAEKANEAKQRAFLYDCGVNPEHCLYERADHLAGLPESNNPLYRSIDTWSFSVALNRAQKYYAARLQQETTLENTDEEQANSELRKRFYVYAIEELGKGYVHEDTTGFFEANFPKLPKNTSELRTTSLYLQNVYPITQKENKSIMHAWDGCSSMGGQQLTGYGSLSQMDAGGYTTCESCKFSVSSFGKIAAATSSVPSGFEYHYLVIADAAQAYEDARNEYAPHAEKVKSMVDSLFEELKEAISEVTSYRIDVAPPGRIGAVSLLANTQTASASKNFLTSFVKSEGRLGVQVALSAAALASDSATEGKNIISSLLDGLDNSATGFGIDAFDMVLELWSSLLFAYTNGQTALQDGVMQVLDSIPFASASGLGRWASQALSDLLETLGLEPVELDAPKPVIINSTHVLSADESGFSSRLLSIKKSYLESTSSQGLFSAAISELETAAVESISELSQSIVIASIELFGDSGVSIPITIALPPSITSGIEDIVAEGLDFLRGIESHSTVIRRWE